MSRKILLIEELPQLLVVTKASVKPNVYSNHPAQRLHIRVLHDLPYQFHRQRVHVCQRMCTVVLQMSFTSDSEIFRSISPTQLFPQFGAKKEHSELFRNIHLEVCKEKLCTGILLSVRSVHQFPDEKNKRGK